MSSKIFFLGTAICFVELLVLAVYFFKRALTESIVFSFLSNTLLLYLFFVLSIPKYYIIAPIILLAYILKNLKLIKFEKPKFSFSITIFYSSIFLFLISIPVNFKFMGWDEFSAWASRTKWIFGSLRLWNESEIQFFAEYPPILHLLHLQSGILSDFIFRENYVISIHVLLLLLLVGDIWFTRSSLSQSRMLAGYFLNLIVIYFFGFKLLTVVPDLLLALMFLNTLIRIHFFQKSMFNIAYVMVLLSFMSLLKPTGIVLSLICLGYFIFKWRNHNFNIFLFLFFVNFLFFISWQIRTRVLNLNEDGYSFFGIVKRLFKKFIEKHPEFSSNESIDFYDTDYLFVASKMISDFFLGDIIYGIPLAVCILLGLFLFRPPFSVAIYFIISFLIYELVLFLTYITLMWPVEAKATASHSRYAATILMPLSIMWIRIIAEKNKGRYLKSLTLIFAFLSFLIPPLSFFSEVKNRQPYSDSIYLRDAAKDLVKDIDYLPNEKFLFVDQNSESLGYSRLIFFFEIIPSQVEMCCWSFGDPYFEGDIWTVNTPLNLLLIDVDYVVIKKADMKFYEKLTLDEVTFDKKLTSGIFRVEINNGNYQLIAL